MKYKAKKDKIAGIAVERIVDDDMKYFVVLQLVIKFFYTSHSFTIVWGAGLKFVEVIQHFGQCLVHFFHLTGGHSFKTFVEYFAHQRHRFRHLLLARFR